MQRWAALIRDYKGEESRLVSFIIFLINFLEQISFCMYLYIKEL